MLTLFTKQFSSAMPCRCCFDGIFEAIFNCDAIQGNLFVLNDCTLNGADSHALTLFSQQFYISMPCQVICLFFESLHHSAGSCVLTLFMKQFSSAMPCR